MKKKISIAAALFLGVCVLAVHIWAQAYAPGQLFYNPVEGAFHALANGGVDLKIVTGVVSSAFNAITSGTNTTAAMVCGTGCSINPSGSGVINATQANGLAFAASATTDTTNGSNITSGQIAIGRLGSAGLSGTAPIVVAATGAISCPTCSAAPTALDRFFAPPNIISSTAANVAPVLTGSNAINWAEVTVPSPGVTFSKMMFYVQTADNTANRYDVCIYNLTGTLQANLGATQFATTGEKDIATLQGSITLPAATYLFGWTGNATTAALYTQIAGANYVRLQLIANPATTSSGGVCPNSATVPASSATNVTVAPLWIGIH